MHYYQHHIGDFIKATSRLSDSQAMAYLRLMWLYYEQEAPLTKDLNVLAFKIGSDIETVELILNSFFKFNGENWFQTRCDELIEAYKKQSSGGKKGSEIRWAKAKALANDGVAIGEALGEAITTNNHKPITNNQEPITNLNNLLSEPKVPTCPQDKVLFLWKKHLPHLTQPRSWEGTRQQTLKQRWIQASKESAYSDGYKSTDEGLTWWDSFFEYIAKQTKLSQGFESDGRVWRPTLEWVLKLENFQKIVDGKYAK
jgi:uncharacterized protein YdaU (DUF1376 family)